MQDNSPPSIKSLIEKIVYRRYLGQIQFTRDVKFLYFHGAKLYHFLCKALRENSNRLGDDILIHPIESGRVFYKAGEKYNFGITKFVFKEDFIGLLKIKLNELTGKITRKNSIEGSFKLINIEELKNPELPDFKEGANEFFTIRLLSPLRMLRETPEKGHRYFDKDLFDVNRFIMLLFRRFKRIAELFEPYIARDLNIKLPDVKLTEKNLMWVDMPYTSKTLGGVIGKVTFSVKLNEELKCLLWFGQLMQVGNNVAFGFGKYSVENHPDFFFNDITRYESFLEKSLSFQNVSEAFYFIKNKVHKSSPNKKEFEVFEKSLDKKLKGIIEDVKSSKYEPEDLQGLFIKKNKSKKLRALAIPSLKDRILQRAVVQVLSPSIDRLLDESSYAYRKGLSRLSAAKTIKESYKEGFRYVLETDIETFFDSVNWKILFDRIDIILNSDPLGDIIKKWVSVPVIYNGKKIIRTLGLPQGSAISPLLANLYLDEFDEIIKDNFKLVRYCDDFVILCKSKEEAEKALNTVKENLNNLMLDLNPVKTEITSFDAGFQYLGYLFVRSKIIETSGKKSEEKIPYKEKEILQHQNNWHANIDLHNIKELKTGAEITNLNLSMPDELETKIPILISSFDTKVTVTHDTLCLLDQTDKKTKIPLTHVNSVTFFGTPNKSLYTILYLKDSNIPSYFCRPNGKMYLSFGNEKNYNMWYKQMKLTKNIQFILNFSKKIVEAKINNSKIISKRNGWGEKSFKVLASLQSRTNDVEELEKLRGIEGIAARFYFDEMKKAIPNEWNFKKRVKYPPTDPVNVMLSIGYTILYNHISTALHMQGLNPEIGFYHSLKSNHNALASDIIEEYRFLIDSLILYIVHRKMFSIYDFEHNHRRFKCFMKRGKRNKFITLVEERLRTNYNFEEGEMSYIENFNQKSESIKNIINGHTENYKPFLIKK